MLIAHSRETGQPAGLRETQTEMELGEYLECLTELGVGGEGIFQFPWKSSGELVEGT